VIAVSLESRVKANAEDRSGRLWISMGSGTFRLEPSGWTSLESLGGPREAATAEFTDAQGRIWFGFTNTIAMLDGDRVKTFSASDGVQAGAVTSIQGDGRTIWIGGELGLEFFDGSRFQRVNPSDGSAFACVSGIVAEPDGGLWFSDNRGIVHIPEVRVRSRTAMPAASASGGERDRRVQPTNGDRPRKRGPAAVRPCRRARPGRRG